MSKNFFAALDDSDDEGAGTPAVKVEAAKPKKPAAVKPAPVVEPSKPDERLRPNHNDRNTKFGRGGRAPPRDGKRAYERRSGTGRGKEIKKDGGGARNWGSDKNEAREASGQVIDEEAVAGEETAPAEPTTENEEAAEAEQEPEPEPEPEPEDTTLSYEEYLALKKEKEASGLLAPVKTRDVVDEFQNVKPKTAVEEDFLVMGGAKQKRVRDKKTEKALDEAAKELLAFRVAPESDRPRGRGRGRDGGRGGRGEGGRGRYEGGRVARGEGRGRGEGRYEGRGEGRYEGRGEGGRGGGRYEGRGGGREGGYRGGRGDGRGRSRGRGRGGRGGRNELNVLDETAFPSL